MGMFLITYTVLPFYCLCSHYLGKGFVKYQPPLPIPPFKFMTLSCMLQKEHRVTLLQKLCKL